MTTANLSVGIDTKKAKSDLKDLLENMQDQVGRTGLKKLKVEVDSTKIADSLAAVLRNNTLQVNTTQATGGIELLQKALANTVNGLNISLGDFADKFAANTKGMSAAITRQIREAASTAGSDGAKAGEEFGKQFKRTSRQVMVEGFGMVGEVKGMSPWQHKVMLNSAVMTGTGNIKQGDAEQAERERRQKLEQDWVQSNIEWKIKQETEAARKYRQMTERRDSELNTMAQTAAKRIQDLTERRDVELHAMAQTAAKRIQEITERRDVELNTMAQTEAKRIQGIIERRDTELNAMAQTAAKRIQEIVERRAKSQFDEATREANRLRGIQEKRDIDEYNEKANHLTRMKELDARYEVSSIESKLRNAKLAQAYAAQGLNPAQYVGPAAASMGNAAGITQLESQAKSATHAVNGLSASMRDAHSAARGLAAGFQSMWMTWGNIVPLMAGFALSSAVKESVEGFAKVQYQMTFVKGLTQNTTDSVKELSGAMHEVSLSLGLSPVEASAGLRALTQAGLDTKTAMMALPDVFKLATVGELSMGEAALAATGISNAFHLSMTNIGHVGDVLALAGAKSATSVASMTESMKMASVVASQYGLQLEEVSVVLTALAKRNITGTSAGTATKNMFNEMANPQSTDAKTAAKTLNFNSYEGEGASRKMRPILDQVEELRGKLAEFDKESQGKLMRALFGERGDKAFGSLMAMSREELAGLKSDLENADGFTTKVFMDLQQTVQGQFGMMKSQIMNTFAEVGETSANPIIDMVRKIREAFASEELKSSIRGLTQSVMNIMTLAIEYGPVIAKMFIAYKGASIALEALIAVRSAHLALATAASISAGATAAAGTATGVMRIALLAISNPITAVLAVVTALGAAWLLLKEHQETAVEAAQRDIRTIDDTTEALKRENEQAQKKLDLRKQGAVEDSADKKTAVDVAQSKVNDLSSKIENMRLLKTSESKIKPLEDQLFREQQSLQALSDQYDKYIRIRKEAAELAKKEQAEADARFKANLKSGDRKYNPDTNAAAMGSQEKNEALEMFRHNVEMAKQWHDADIAILNDQLKKKLIAQEDYQDRKKAIDEKYESKRTKAYDESKDYINNHARGKMDQDSQRKGLDNAVQKMKDQNSEAKQKDEVDGYKQTGLDSNVYMAEANKIIDKSKELSDKVSRDIKKLQEQRGIKLMRAEDQAALTAYVKTEAEFQVEIDKANQEVEKAREHYHGNTVEVIALMEAVSKLGEAQKEAAQQSAEAARAEIEYTKTAEYGWDHFWQKYQDGATTAAKVVEETMTNVTDSMTNAVADFCKTGTFNWRSMASNILIEMVKLETKYMLSKVFKGDFDFSDGPLTKMMHKGLEAVMPSKTIKDAVTPGVMSLDPKNAASKLGGAGTGDMSKATDGAAKSLEKMSKATEASTLAEKTKETAVNASAAAEEVKTGATEAATAADEIDTGVTEAVTVTKEIEQGLETEQVVANTAEIGSETTLAAVQEAVAAEEMALLLAANGASFGGSGTEYFAKGGSFTGKVYNTPTPFKFASGGSFKQGIMGEAGPEAVMPLARDGQGRLGVRYQPMQSSQQSDKSANQAAPAQNNIRIVNAFDTAVISDHMGSVEGEKIIMNVVRKNPTLIKRLAQG